MYELQTGTRAAEEAVKQENQDISNIITQKCTSTDINLVSPTSENPCTESTIAADKNLFNEKEVKLKIEIPESTVEHTYTGPVKVKLQESDISFKEICSLTPQYELHAGNGNKKKKIITSLKRKEDDNKITQNAVKLDKKKRLVTKKLKHKNYEKPNDEILKHYQCTLCPKAFQRVSNFNAHQRTHSPLSARPFSCQDCKNTFHYRCQLRDHIRIHTGERPFKCHSCNKTFARKGCLVAHMVTHSDALPFQCDICCKRFARKYNLAKHLQSHSGDRPFRCVNCSRRFKCKQSLDKHYKIHELNIYSCAICQESFDTKRRLTHHKINEHVSYRPFTCQICHKPFIFKSQLTYHIKEHNLERPYSCGKCNKSYFKKGHLLSHIKQYCSDFVPVPQVKIEILT